VIDRVRGLPAGELSPMRPAGGEIILGAILLEIEHGLTLSLSRVS
jgi:hypothetical protein